MKNQTYSEGCKISVKKTTGGRTITLCLHKRLNHPCDKPKPFWCVSWRTTLGKQNRRFYKHEGKFWEIPVKIACGMLNEMFKEGGLDSKWDDRWDDKVVKKRTSVCSGRPRDNDCFSEILAKWPEDKIMWDSRNLKAIVFRAPKTPWNPNCEWWKVMIVDIERRRVTFRTIGNDENYGMKMYNLLKSDEGWFMDNAMMDADPCVMRYFRKTLLRLVD